MKYFTHVLFYKSSLAQSKIVFVGKAHMFSTPSVLIIILMDISTAPYLSVTAKGPYKDIYTKQNCRRHFTSIVLETVPLRLTV